MIWKSKAAKQCTRDKDALVNYYLKAARTLRVKANALQNEMIDLRQLANQFEDAAYALKIGDDNV